MIDTNSLKTFLRKYWLWIVFCVALVGYFVLLILPKNKRGILKQAESDLKTFTDAIKAEIDEKNAEIEADRDRLKKIQAQVDDRKRREELAKFINERKRR